MIKNVTKKFYTENKEVVHDLLKQFISDWEEGDVVEYFGDATAFGFGDDSKYLLVLKKAEQP